MEMTEVWDVAVKELVRGGEEPRFARAPVKEVCRCGEGFGPPAWWHGGMEKKGADSVIKCTKNALGLAILLGRVGARETKAGAM